MFHKNEIVYFLGLDKKNVYKGVITNEKDVNGNYVIFVADLVNVSTFVRKENEIFESFAWANLDRIKDFKPGDKVYYCLGNKLVGEGIIEESYNSFSWIVKDKDNFSSIVTKDFIFKTQEEAELCHEEYSKINRKCPECGEIMRYRQDAITHEEKWLCENCNKFFYK